MPHASKPELTPGRVYRTRELAQWSKNPSRLALRLEKEGTLRRLSGGLFLHPRHSRFGAVPPTDEELLRRFLDGAPFVFTGPERWNALGLGSTALFTGRLVYNTKRSGEFNLGGLRYFLRRVRFPEHPTTEWYVVDLLENHKMAGVAVETIEASLAQALKAGRFRGDLLMDAAQEFGTHTTRTLVKHCVRNAESNHPCRVL